MKGPVILFRPFICIAAENSDCPHKPRSEVHCSLCHWKQPNQYYVLVPSALSFLPIQLLNFHHGDSYSWLYLLSLLLFSPWRQRFFWKVKKPWNLVLWLLKLPVDNWVIQHLNHLDTFVVSSIICISCQIQSLNLQLKGFGYRGWYTLRY